MMSKNNWRIAGVFVGSLIVCALILFLVKQDRIAHWCAPKHFAQDFLFARIDKPTIWGCIGL